MKIILFLIILLLLVNVSATCEKVYEVRNKNPTNFYVFMDDSVPKKNIYKESYKISNYLKGFKPYKNYKFTFYYEKNIGDCAYLIDCNALGVKITYQDMKQQGYTTSKKVNKTNYQLIYINPKYNTRPVYLHEFGHAIGGLKDLDVINDPRDKARRTLMHYGSAKYYLTDWQISDLNNNIIELKKWCKINKS